MKIKVLSAEERVRAREARTAAVLNPCSPGSTEKWGPAIHQPNPAPTASAHSESSALKGTTLTLNPTLTVTNHLSSPQGGSGWQVVLCQAGPRVN